MFFKAEQFGILKEARDTLSFGPFIQASSA
jgi:hypothetical protein